MRDVKRFLFTSANDDFTNFLQRYRNLSMTVAYTNSYRNRHLSLGNLVKLVFWSIVSFKNSSFASLSAFDSSHFVSVSLMRINLRGLRENLKNKI